MKKRVKIPVNNPKELLDLAKKVQAKHTVDAANSVLKALNWTTITPTITEATALHDKAEKAKRDMLEAYQLRDLKIEAIANALRDSRDILSGVYKKEMKVLGQWGYEVLDIRSVKAEPQPAKAVTVAG
jgi:hypothetical protein